MNNKIYLNWRGASDAGYFEYYDKESSENKQYKFDEIRITDKAYTVKGWDENSNSQIYSNDIFSFSEGENLLKIQTKTGVLYEGPYDKAKVEATGGRIHIKITGVDNEGNIVVLLLKGTNFFKLSETLKSFNPLNNKLKFKEVEDGKKGAVKYKIPIFEMGSEIKDIADEDISDVF